MAGGGARLARQNDSRAAGQGWTGVLGDWTLGVPPRPYLRQRAAGGILASPAAPTLHVANVVRPKEKNRGSKYLVFERGTMRASAFCRQTKGWVTRL